ncbi:MAG: hypothetical protein U5J63_11130 [Fodinibius sp.]|nr:hypothetical protein [Fodinibius sp.]
MPGLKNEEIAELTEDDFPIVRVMPNTAAAINQAMTCVEKTPHDKAEQATLSFLIRWGKHC